MSAPATIDPDLHPEIPPEWASLDRESVLAQMAKRGRDANTCLAVARWLEISGYADQSYAYYCLAIGLNGAHVGTFGRFFERAFMDGAYLVAQFVAKEAVRSFPKEPRPWLWAARAAAAFGDRAMYNQALEKATSMKVAPIEVDLVRQHTEHFFKK